MKKLLFVLMALVATTFTSCKKEEKATLIGTWKWEKAVNISDDSEFQPNYQQYVEFDAAGEFTTIMFDKEQKSLVGKNVTNATNGTFTNVQNNLILSKSLFEDGLREGTVKFLSDSEVRITITEGMGVGHYIVLTRKNLNVISIYDKLVF